MRHVLLLGDSIRMGYQETVKRLLADTAEVHFPDENGRWSGYTLNTFRFWIRDLPAPDVIHWNNGLWDTGDDYGLGRPFTLPQDYETTLRLMITVLRKTYPEAKIIMATTTPTLDRDQAVIREYNTILRRTAESEHIPVDDLYAALEGKPSLICPDKLHLTREGFEYAGQLVAEEIRKRL